MSFFIRSFISKKLKIFIHRRTTSPYKLNTTRKIQNLKTFIGIDFVGFYNKRHYSHKFNELNPDYNSILV
ncbi:hypothetical protein CN491_08130 [Bacillus cereus]|uniref:Uncharacterized protein n=1 Tax=Bacillus cereus TaxID=1396 RepID=A0A2A8LS34_BACCE|nr:hypothetical protein CN491_08130 [Bacillus cereus]PFP75409.1 hypothetical protein COJ95_17730 [Bacillus cereus]PGT20092.1 hypothetical protein COC96_03830 [Bacillus cereus]